MTTQTILDHLDSKPYLAHRIDQLHKSIRDLQSELKELETILSYVNQVDEVHDGVAIRVSREQDMCEMQTVVVGNEGYRWGHWYKTCFAEPTLNRYGVVYNGKYNRTGENIYHGDTLLGFYQTEDRAEELLRRWIISGSVPA